MFTDQHTHTHICSDLQPWTFFSPGILQPTVDIHCRVFTDDHGLFVCVCEYYLTMDYPIRYPYISPWLELFFSHACLCDLLPIGGSLTIVDVHSLFVSSGLIVIFLMCVKGWRCLQMRTHTHTHTSHSHYPIIPCYKCISMRTIDTYTVLYEWCHIHWSWWRADTWERKLIHTEKC